MMTAVGLWILWICFGPLLDWAIYRGVFSGDSPELCREPGAGACWLFIRERWDLFMYGFYPEGQRWRIGVWASTGLALVYAAFKTSLGQKKTFWIFATLIYPPCIWFLLKQGAPTDQWGGLFLTFLVSSTGIAASFPLGVILALGRRSQGLPIMRWGSTAFIELWRGVPLITVLFMSSVIIPIFFPQDWEWDKLLRALLAISLFSSAYMAEVVRGGLGAVGKGQEEAALALGLSYPDTMELVVLPQALSAVIPGIVNTFIGLFKDTSLITIVGMFDLLGMVKSSLADPQWLGYSKEGYLFAGFCFWIVCYGMSRYSYRVERLYSQDKKR